MVIVKLVISKHYASLSDNLLVNFTGTVLDNGYEKEGYEDVQLQLKGVLDKSLPYSIAVDRSRTDGGKDRTREVTNTRKSLLEKHDILVEMLQTVALDKPNPEAYINKLGYLLVKTPVRKTGVVKPPVLKSWRSGGKDAVRGVVSLVLKAENAKEINAVVGRYSLDGGQTWTGEFVSTKLIFSLHDQPSGKNVMYQFKFLATNNRESVWSPGYEIGVY